MDQLPVPLMNESDILIAVIDITGLGKSSFISYLAGDAAAAVGHTLTSCTTDSTAYMFEHKGKRIFLLDTPGLDDTTRSDAEVLRSVATYLAQIYDKKLHLSGIVYLHRITDNRMSGSSVRNLNMFQGLCGDGASEHIVLATTMWNDVHGNPRIPFEEGEKREQDLKENNKWWGLMEKRGSHVIRHAPNKNSAMEIVDILLSYDSRELVLDIQKELVDEHKIMEETAAGQTVGKELIEQKKKYKEDLQELQADHKDALRGKDIELAEMLRAEREESETKMLAADQAREALKLNYRQLAEQQIAQYDQLFATLEQQKEESRRIEAQQRNERQDTKEHQTLRDQARTNIEREREICKLKRR